MMDTIAIAHRDGCGDNSAEHQQQDDHRRGQSELQFAFFKVVVGKFSEVVIERPLPGDGDLEPAVRVGSRHLIQDIHDPHLGVVAERQQHRDRVLVL